MVQHPPIHVDDLYDHIEILKANDNEKYSSEYESIEPGQQFTWDNRYELEIQSANVFHSCLVWQLPSEVFSTSHIHDAVSIE